MNNERSPLLDLGLFLSVIHGLFWIGMSLIGGVFVALGVGAASVFNPAAMLPASLAGGIAGLVIGIYVGWCVLTLIACVGTYRGSRGWMWVLLLLSVLGLLDFGLLSTPARFLTVIGICLSLGNQNQRVGTA